MEKIKLLLYCTKSKPTLYNVLGKYITSNYLGKDFMQNGRKQPELNGKIVAECDFEVEEIETITLNEDLNDLLIKSAKEKELLEKSCLTKGQLYGYLENGTGYAIHIKNLNIFDKPRELEDYRKVKITKKKFSEIIPNTKYESLIIRRLIQIVAVENAPQNMMYVYDGTISLKETKAIKVERYILISIRPEWLCKILNGEKTIEVRKKVLKEMMQNA